MSAQFEIGQYQHKKFRKNERYAETIIPCTTKEEKFSLIALQTSKKRRTSQPQNENKAKRSQLNNGKVPHPSASAIGENMPYLCGNGEIIDLTNEAAINIEHEILAPTNPNQPSVRKTRKVKKVTKKTTNEAPDSSNSFNRIIDLIKISINSFDGKNS